MTMGRATLRAYDISNLLCAYEGGMSMGVWMGGAVAVAEGAGCQAWASVGAGTGRKAGEGRLGNGMRWSKHVAVMTAGTGRQEAIGTCGGVRAMIRCHVRACRGGIVQRHSNVWRVYCSKTLGHRRQYNSIRSVNDIPASVLSIISASYRNRISRYQAKPQHSSGGTVRVQFHSPMLAQFMHSTTDGSPHLQLGPHSCPPPLASFRPAQAHTARSSRWSTNCSPPPTV